MLETKSAYLGGLVTYFFAHLGCIYQQPIAELHRAATIIQKKWRHWHMFKNSPLAAKYHRKVEELEEAATKIARWWRPLASKLTEKRKFRIETTAAIKIQALWRGKMVKLRLYLAKTTQGRFTYQTQESGCAHAQGQGWLVPNPSCIQNPKVLAATSTKKNLGSKKSYSTLGSHSYSIGLARLLGAFT